jgi:TatD DNase family protein
MIIDTHAHLYYPQLLKDIEGIIQRAKTNQVVKIIIPAVDLKTAETACNLSEKYDAVYCAVGFHPTEIKKHNLSELKELEDFISHKKTVAIGEIGIDFYWDKSNLSQQIEFFESQINIAKQQNLPVIIHTRSSFNEAFEIVHRNSHNLRGQFHCFSEDVSSAQKVLSLENFYLSFCGNITYNNFKKVDTIRAVPLNRLLAETDSPFMTPMPFKGNDNEPSYLKYTLEKIAEIKSIDYQALIKHLYSNTIKLFFEKDENSIQKI